MILATTPGWPVFIFYATTLAELGDLRTLHDATESVVRQVAKGFDLKASQLTMSGRFCRTEVYERSPEAKHFFRINQKARFSN